MPTQSHCLPDLSKDLLLPSQSTLTQIILASMHLLIFKLETHTRWQMDKKTHSETH